VSPYQPRMTKNPILEVAVDFTRNNERAIFTYPQSIDTTVGQVQITGKVNVSPTLEADLEAGLL
jgi:hypothetical protein